VTGLLDIQLMAHSENFGKLHTESQFKENKINLALQGPPTTSKKRSVCTSLIHFEHTVSAQMSHDHIATAFHFLISNRGGAAADLAGFFCTCKI
jgi:hypothetical protein